ncbi:MAG TPA: YhfC family glutamic-type intramembrane protease [Anaerolineaceae bacterium]|nr:YhfC family glutamic-type intramembrane protease [Anaerolineaceae bacterium]
MTNVMFIVAVIIEIGLPIALAVWLTRRYKFGWGIVGVGVLTFIASQIIHIPLLAGIGSGLNALGINFPSGTLGAVLSGLYLGLLAGLCEEPMRYFGFKLLKKRAEPIEAGVLAGAGHGGIESIFVGISVLANMLIAYLVTNTSVQIPGLTPEMVAAITGAPWYAPLLGAFERIFAITLHITLSLIVWHSVSQRKFAWLLLAILYHMFVDAVAVFMTNMGVNMILIEAALLVLTVINIWLLLQMKKHWKKPEVNEPAL